MIDTILIGYTRKPFGVKGQLKLQVESDYLEDIAGTDTIFIDIKGAKVPYFIDDLQIGNDVVVTLEDIDSKEAAAELVGKSVFIRSEDLLPDEERQFEQSEETIYKRYEGFTIEDKVLGSLGNIVSVEEYPQQIMAFLQYKENEVMIPLNDNFIISVDENHKIIKMELPEGLIDL